MTLFLALQNNYHEVQLALMSDNTTVDTRTIPKIKASALCIPTLQELLDQNNVNFESLSFLVVNQGPGPFTTLRVVISTVNGLSFASNIPLIGIDALEACLQEWKDPNYPIDVVLLNAFANDVYFAIKESEAPVQKGSKNIDLLLQELVEKFPDQLIRFLGNGTKLFKDNIEKMFGNNAVIPQAFLSYCSITQIGKMGLEQWQKGNKGTFELLPLYLKQHQVQR